MIKSIVSILGFALACASPVARTETFPTKAVTIVVPFAAGGPSDAIARVLAEELGKKWGTVIVDNKGGANTIIGTQQVIRSAPDGYTILLGTFAWVTNPILMEKSPYDPKALISVAFLGEQPQIMYLRKDILATSVPDLAAYVRKRGKPLMIGTPGIGSSPHLTAVDFANRTGIPVEYISYKGAAPANNDLVGGQIDAVFIGDSNRSYVDAGRINALFIARDQRLPAWQHLPTAREAGLPSFESAAWFVLMVPSGTPESVKTKIAIDVNNVLANQDVRSKFEKRGVFARTMTSAQVNDFVESERAKLGLIIKKNNIKLE